MKGQNVPQHNNFVISLAGPTIDTTTVTIEEMNYYTEQRRRIAVIGTEKKSYSDLSKMNYQLIDNYHKPKVMVINTRNRPYLDVFKTMLERFHTGLMVIETDTISEPVSELITKSDLLAVNDIDIMICHHGYEELTLREVECANLLRIHAIPDLNPIIFQTMQEYFKEVNLGVMVSQLFVNEQYEESKAYFDKFNGVYEKEGLKDYIDYYEMNKQFAYFIYFDIKKGKILNVSRDKVFEFLKKMKATNMLPVDDSQISVIAEGLTV